MHSSRFLALAYSHQNRLRVRRAGRQGYRVPAISSSSKFVSSSQALFSTSVDNNSGTDQSISMSDYKRVLLCRFNDIPHLNKLWSIKSF